MIESIKDVLKDRVDGITEEQAAQGARAVTDLLKDRLPAPIAAKLEELVDGDGKGDLDLGAVTDGIKGFLNR